MLGREDPLEKGYGDSMPDQLLFFTLTADYLRRNENNPIKTASKRINT